MPKPGKRSKFPAGSRKKAAPNRKMKNDDPTNIQRTRDLLSGLIQQQDELGSLGYSLVILLLGAGVQPAFQTTKESLYLPAPEACQ